MPLPELIWISEISSPEYSEVACDERRSADYTGHSLSVTGVPMISPANVRLALSGDLDALLDLDAIARRESKRRSFIAQALTSGQCWVAEDPSDTSVLLGYGVLNDSFFEQAFIPLVVVRDSARRRGVGSAIIRALESRCRAAKLFTSTNASNEPMRRLLAQLGFIPSGQVDNLDEGDPELIFVKLRP